MRASASVRMRVATISPRPPICAVESHREYFPSLTPSMIDPYPDIAECSGRDFCDLCCLRPHGLLGDQDGKLDRATRPRVQRLPLRPCRRRGQRNAGQRPFDIRATEHRSMAGSHRTCGSADRCRDAAADVVAGGRDRSFGPFGDRDDGGPFDLAPPGSGQCNRTPKREAAVLPRTPQDPGDHVDDDDGLCPGPAGSRGEPTTEPPVDQDSPADRQSCRPA